ncbi:MAG: serine/threonine protein kinase [Stenomitos frigidus ULC029]
MSDILVSAEVSYPELERLLDGRYQVNQILASGDWGRTYLAQDTRRPSQPDCIIQHVIPVTNDDAYRYALRHLFVREAATLERLGEHGQMPRLLACFEDEQGLHLVQEFVSGDSLSLELLPQPCHEEQVVQLLLECLELLAVMHSECCRHGDVRPDNFIRRSQDSKLTLINFGTGRDVHLSLMTLQGQAALSRVPNVQGYQPPEQVQGLPCLASDIYAIGLIGIQALTGVQPLQLNHDPKTGELLWQPFGPVAGSTLRHGLVAVLSRMVRADQTQRYPSAKAALQAVRSLAQGVPLERVEVSIAVDSSALTLSQETVQASMLTEATEPNTLPERWLSPAVQIGVGIGAVMAAAVCGYALPHLLDRSLLGNSDRGEQSLADATQEYQAGQLQKAVTLAASIPKDSAAYVSAQEAIVHWQKDWQTAERKTQAATAALQKGNSLAVLQQAQGLPQIDYWQQRVQPLVQQSTQQAAAAAAQLLRDAYGRAIVKDFAGAIVALKQIPEGTSVHTKAQEKLREYVEKQQIQSISYLQVAYDQAEAKMFDKALKSLQKISGETPTHATAQAKIREYTAKQRIQTAVLARQDLNPGSYLQETNLAGR